MEAQRLRHHLIDYKVKNLLTNEREINKVISITNPQHPSSQVVSLALSRILSQLKKEKPSEILLDQVTKYWIPIANNFGMWKMRYQLEDRCFELQDKKKYSLVRSLIKRKHKIHHNLFKNIVEIVSHYLKEEGMSDYKLLFRQKNIYGIYKKMERKNKNINFMTDWFGIRIVVKTIPQCYKVLGILHYLWVPIPDTLIDYVKNPKPNGYQSIHTTLHCLDKQTVEFQIRTNQMDNVAKYGSASHSTYKRSTS